MVRQRFTGAEDVALLAILKDREEQTRRVDWRKVAKQLQERGFPNRSTKSVRNHHLRRANAPGYPAPAKNRCRKCGKLQRGHVCEIMDEGSGPAASEAEP